MRETDTALQILDDGTYIRILRTKDFHWDHVTVWEVTESQSGILRNGDQYVLQGVRADILASKDGEGKPWKTLVLMNGGASNAVGSLHMANMAVLAAKNIGMVETHNLRVIVLPHLESMPRQLVGNVKSYEKMAEVLEKFLFNPELKPTEDLNLVGFSAGGAQIIALAAQLGSKCKNLVLMDSAGLSEHKNLAYEFTVGTIIALFKKYKGRVDLISKEMGNAWSSTRYVAGSFAGILADIIERKSENEVDTLGKKFGIDKKHRGKIGLDINLTKSRLDLEILSRVYAKIIYAPLIFAKVVNDAIDGLGEQKVALQLKKGKLPDEIEGMMKKYLEKMFIHNSGIEVIVGLNPTHSSVMNDQKYWGQVFAKLVD